eukprot:CAMPEP_0117436312 /NCGR_PEP_ID=MMETSP0759-20121206/942_1 /TAXON_ID=63605 /ORGANISM="Percolomonas cosmopolitus, Strain WS" /LENGTH=264 /DNA_ID=CAMNT_0005227907 /DNA_START=68 /DNA_END=862 /DNA_ORIENTATION=-
MFEAKLEQGSTLKKILEAVKQLVQEANFDCSDRGMHLQAMDTSHVSLVHLVLKASSFDSYRCDRSMALGIHMGNLSKILKCAGNNDAIALSADDDGDVMKIKFSSNEGDTESTFKLKLVNIEADPLGIPESDHESVITLPASRFQQICRDLAQIGDTVTISVSKKGVGFAVSGQLGDGEIKIRPSGSVDSDEQTIIESTEDVSLTFSLKYLNDFTKSSSLSKNVVLRMSSEAPLIVEYNISDEAFIRYYLAPKISEDDDDDEEQ